jgi:hypothetical protein
LFNWTPGPVEKTRPDPEGSISQIQDVHVNAQPDVIGKVIAGVVWIVIDHDVVVVPEPVVSVVVIVLRELEVEAANAEPFAIAATKAPDVLRANASREASVFPRMVQMIVGVPAARVVSHPNIILVNVRGLGMVGLIVKGASLLLRLLLLRRSRAAVDRPAIRARGRRFSATGRSGGGRRANRSGPARGNISPANVTATLLCLLSTLLWLGLLAPLLRLGRLRLLLLLTTLLVAASLGASIRTEREGYCRESNQCFHAVFHFLSGGRTWAKLIITPFIRC